MSGRPGCGRVGFRGFWGEGEREGCREDTGLFTLSDQPVIQPKDNFVVFGNQGCKPADRNNRNPYLETRVVN